MKRNQKPFDQTSAVPVASASGHAAALAGHLRGDGIVKPAPETNPAYTGPEAETFLEIAADPVTWAAMMLTKVGKPGITVGEAMEQVRSIVRRAIAMSAAPDGIADLIKRAKAVLPEGWTIRVYIEPGFAYVYLQRPDQTVHNMDMHEKLTIAEQLALAVSMLPPPGRIRK